MALALGVCLSAALRIAFNLLNVKLTIYCCVSAEPRLHATLVSVAKLMRCIQSSLVIACDCIRYNLNNETTLLCLILFILLLTLLHTADDQGLGLDKGLESFKIIC